MSDTTVWTEYLIAGEPALTVTDRFRLVEIAHTTAHADVRKWALDTLERASFVPPMFKPQVVKGACP